MNSNPHFLVLAHDDVSGLGELLDALSPYGATVHIDRPYYLQLTPRGVTLNFREGVRVISRPGCLHWGGYSIHVAMMQLLRHGLSQNPEATHFAFLSGACFPLRPIAQFAQHLDRSRHAVHCNAFALDQRPGAMGIERVSKRHHLDGFVGHVRKMNRWAGGAARKVLLQFPQRIRDGSLANAPHFAGSQWTAFPREMAQELVSHHEQGGFLYLKNSFASDEMAIPTFVHRSRWGRLTQRGVDAATPQSMAGTANFHWLRSDLQGTITWDDLSIALDSDKFFVRKLPTGPDGSEIRQAIQGSWRP